MTERVELCVGNASNPDDRPRILVSEADERSIAAGRFNDDIVTVFCYARQKKLRVRWTDCGLPGCRCAIEIVRPRRR